MSSDFEKCLFSNSLSGKVGVFIYILLCPLSFVGHCNLAVVLWKGG